jgi:hypothetical protein
MQIEKFKMQNGKYGRKYESSKKLDSGFRRNDRKRISGLFTKPSNFSLKIYGYRV